MTVSDLNISSIVFDICYSKIRKRPIKKFDLDKKEITLGELGEKEVSKYNTPFVFDSLEDSSLKEYGDLGRNNLPVIFFTKEDAVRGLITALEKRIKDDEEEIVWRADFIKKTKKRLSILKHNKTN